MDQMKCTILKIMVSIKMKNSHISKYEILGESVLFIKNNDNKNNNNNKKNMK